LAAWSALCITDRAAAQVCSGERSVDRSAKRLFVNVAFGNSQTYHAGLAVGGKRVFGWAEGGVATTGDDQASQYWLGGGVQLSRRPETRLHICPELLLGRNSESDVGGTTLAFVHLTASAGADVAYVLLRKRSTRIVPTTNVQFVTGRIKWLYINGIRRTHGLPSYGLLRAGIALGFDEFTVSPSIVVPLGLEGGQSAFRMAFSIGI